MAGRTQTYAIRLAVEGGGQVKAELVSVGQSGEAEPEAHRVSFTDYAAISGPSIADELFDRSMPQHALGLQMLYPHPQLGSQPLS
jgi:hypothetical protein